MRRPPSDPIQDEDDSKSPIASTASVMVNEKSKDIRTRDHSRESRASTKISNGGNTGRARPRDLTQRTSTPRSTSSSRGRVAATSEVAMEPKSHRPSSRRLWSCSLLTLATTACSIIVLVTIIHSFLTLQLDTKGCAMSYMMPAFAHFSDFDTEHTRFASKYSLYMYREGGVDEDTRVKGVPVLFIPGNAGSYKQVRPIAAEAAHYFHDVLRQDLAAVAGGKRPLDIFTVDFNEELTAFHGQTLLDQAEYLNEAVAYILALYHNPNRSLREPGLPDPKSVIIIGHSMGGVVARTMLNMPNYQDQAINTIITLSAPHARPPVSFDADMVATYNKINTFWREAYSSSSLEDSPLADVTLVSVAGGGLDTMIPSEFTSLTSLVPDSHGFTVFTSAIPTVWTGMDHLAIMWCDQLRKALVKAIFDVVDVRRPSQTLRQPDRIQSLRKRLLTGMESVVQKADLAREQTTYLTLEPRSAAIMSHDESLRLRVLGDAGDIRAHIMPIPSQPSIPGSRFTLMTDQRLSSVEEDGGLVTVLLCSVVAPDLLTEDPSVTHASAAHNSLSATRLACKNAASDMSLLPRSTNESLHAFDSASPFSYLQYSLSDLAHYQFIAIVDRASEPSQGWVMAEFSTELRSSKKISKGHHQLLLTGMDLELPSDRPMMMELKIPEVHSTLFAYRLHLERHLQTSCDEKFAPLLRQYIQEPYESKFFVNLRDGDVNVHGISPYMPPPLRGGGQSEGLSLQIWTDPSCPSKVDVSLKFDVLGSAGKMVMRYRTVFAAVPLLVVAIALRKQFKVYDATGVFISFSQSMDQCVRSSLPAIFIALAFLVVALSKAAQRPWSPTASPAENAVDFTVNDLMLGTSDPFFWFMVPLFGVIGIGVAMAANYVVLIVTHILAFSYAFIQACIYRFDDPRHHSSYFATASPQQRVLTLAVLLLLVSTVVPYQFAYLVLCLVQLATSVRALRLARVTKSDRDHNLYNYVHSMLLLMLWILPINMPVLVVWVHNLTVHWWSPFSTHHNLISILPYILLIETMSTGSMIPRASRMRRIITNIFLFAFALYAAVYGVTYAYRLHHLVNLLCAWLFSIHLTHGPFSRARRAPSTSPAVHDSKKSISTSRSPLPPEGRRAKKRP